ncbi:MAG: alanine--tRNA ligase [Dehalococcoidia bacterium]|nr:alanine--tRNA ligase [Dehalococcoidia bacterium]MCB9483553.1 alanine--tRNA ligase [Dehalococcoidia bacterium]MCB9492194.1 alanine--tRNA ligase [Dehalococcoidia bacterium]
MKVDELRQAFLSFFEERGHRRIPSSSLVPHGDPTLLFTTAGMVQFKPYFMGLEDPPATRLTSIQRCFRTTDIEEVGDENHLTMFEMLGNFSIGDYFKDEAVDWAWEFLTGVLKIDPNRLRATVYVDDDYAFSLWEKKGITPDRIHRYTAEQGNWWGPPGDTGPMGPCSEVFFDWGQTPGCPTCADGTCHPDEDCGRFLEIWNLVFMTYYREEDGSQTDLPAANIDTGAGLERLTSVLTGNKNVYETDELRQIVAVAETLSGRTYDPDENPEVAFALRAMTEHARALAFLVTDGVLPSNEGRGYVLRRLLRRAVYFAHKIGVRDPFLAELASAAIDRSLGANPELAEQREFIKRIATVEETRFRQTLERGLDLLEEIMQREQESRRIPGRDAFVLYDTHGLPLELTLEMALEAGYEVDRAGFEAEMEAQRERSRGEEQFTNREDDRAQRYASMDLDSVFMGYGAVTHESTITHLNPPTIEEGQAGEVVLAETPFYPEGGGQVGDRGVIRTDSGVFEVQDTQRYGGAIVHLGVVTSGTIESSGTTTAQASVDAARRLDTARNHTATHLLHAALRSVLGTHVRQAGSYVGPDRLRFDYTHPESPTDAERREFQSIVNQKVRADIRSATFELEYQEAMDRGAIAFFEDRYTERVRMVEYCDSRGLDPDHRHTADCYSRELCGGTHLDSTGQIGSFVVVSDTSIGAGLRRIEALTGASAEQYIEDRLAVLDDLSRHLRVPADEVAARVTSLEQSLEEARKRAQDAARRASASAADDLVSQAVDAGGAKLLVARVTAEDAGALRPMVDRLRQQLGSSFIVLAADIGGKPNFIAAATDDLVERGARADEVVKIAAGIAGGGGGGRPQLAQAGGRDASKIDEALAAAREAALGRLGGT